MSTKPLPDRWAFRPRDAAAHGPGGGGGDRLRWLLRRISDDDRGAFAELFHQLSGPMSIRVRLQVADPIRVAGVVAGTFVEVWWLAGCHIDADADVMAWINKIVRRRVADSRPPARPVMDSGALTSLAPSSSPLGTLWAQHVEVELAGLLRRRTTPQDAPWA